LTLKFREHRAEKAEPDSRFFDCRFLATVSGTRFSESCAVKNGKESAFFSSWTKVQQIFLTRFALSV
jgi:hypothetical protein